MIRMRRRVRRDGPLRVLHVVPDLVPYGLENMVAGLCTKSGAGIRTGVVSLYGEVEGSLAPKLRDAGVPVFHLDKKRGFDPRMFTRFDSVIRRFRPDVVHTHNYVLRYTLPSCLLRGVAARVHTIHNVADHEVDRIGVGMQKLVFPATVHPVAIAGEVARSFQRVYGYEPPSTIPNGVPLEKFRAARGLRTFWRRKERIPESATVILCVARLFEQKNHKTLLSAFAQAVEYVPDALLLLAGDGELLGNLEAQARDLGVQDRVRFLGRRSDIAHALAASDIFALASLWEGNPLSVMEAMAAGRPGVVTRVGAIPELVRHGEDGLIVDPGDTRAMTEALVRLCADPELRRLMGDSARERAQERFSEEAMVDSYERLYRRLLGKPERAMPQLTGHVEARS